MFAADQEFFRSDAILPVIEHHGFTGQSPLKGLKPFLSGIFNPLKRVSHR
jgi:hypothetical protein